MSRKRSRGRESPFKSRLRQYLRKGALQPKKIEIKKKREKTGMKKETQKERQTHYRKRGKRVVVRKDMG